MLLVLLLLVVRSDKCLAMLARSAYGLGSNALSMHTVPCTSGGLVQCLTVIELSLLDRTCSCFIKFALPQMYAQCSNNYQTVSAHLQHTALICLTTPVLLQSV